MKNYYAANRHVWDRWTRAHVDSDFYDLAAFKQGGLSLKPIEVQELGDVTGKSLLHLQCHFGLDTLSWARLGARVVGADFSKESITAAKSLSKELDIPANFVCANIYELPERLVGDFDIVFTSYGVLTWLHDLSKWSEIIRHFLRPGGIFYLIEFHPLLTMLADDGRKLVHPYFHAEQPVRYDQEESYAAAREDSSFEMYEWAHSVGEVVSVLTGQGLVLEYLHEFPYSSYDCFPFLERLGPDQFVVKGQDPAIPAMFSLKARRPA